MFGMGGSEILVILVVALLFLGPDKLPEAAKSISKGIRDLKKQTRELQSTIENDTEIGGAIRDIKSALRGDDPKRPPVRKPPPKPGDAAADATAGAVAAGAAGEIAAGTPGPTLAPPSSGSLADAVAAAAARVQSAEPAVAAEGSPDAEPAATATATAPVVTRTVPPTAGEPDPVDDDVVDDDDDVAAMIRPSRGTVAQGEAADSDDAGTPDHAPS